MIRTDLIEVEIGRVHIAVRAVVKRSIAQYHCRIRDIQTRALICSVTLECAPVELQVRRTAILLQDCSVEYCAVAGKNAVREEQHAIRVRPDTNGVLLFADCIFSSYGTVFNGTILQQDGRAPYLQFDRCTFQGDGTNQSASLYVAYTTVVLRNTSFNNGSYCDVYPAYLYLDQVSSDHST